MARGDLFTNQGDLVWDVSLDESDAALITHDGAEEEKRCCDCDEDDIFEPLEDADCLDCLGLCCEDAVCVGPLGFPPIEIFVNIDGQLDTAENHNGDVCECEDGGDRPLLTYHGFLPQNCGLNSVDVFRPLCEWVSNDNDPGSFATDNCGNTRGMSAVMRRVGASVPGKPHWEVSLYGGGAVSFNTPDTFVQGDCCGTDGTHDVTWFQCTAGQLPAPAQPPGPVVGDVKLQMDVSRFACCREPEPGQPEGACHEHDPPTDCSTCCTDTNPNCVNT